MGKTFKIILPRYEVKKDGLGCIFVKVDGIDRYAEFHKGWSGILKTIGGGLETFRMTKKQMRKFFVHISKGNSLYLTFGYKYMRIKNKYAREDEIRG